MKKDGEFGGVDTWRIIAVDKWSITMVNTVSPLSRVVPFPNGLNS